MMPSLRRVYLGDEEDSRARIESLSAEIATLKTRVGTLHRDNGLLMDRCESAQSTISRLTVAERDARLALNKATKGLRLANQTLENLRREYEILISQ
jgi:chromosome segregation ATPase